MSDFEGALPPENASDDARAGGSGKLSLLPILLVNGIGTLGFSLVLPFLVFLVTDFGGNAFVYGLIAATYPAFQMVGAPILGRWSDQTGRRKILLLSQGGTLLSWLIFVLALSIPITPVFEVSSELVGVWTVTVPLLILGFARALDGITGGNISVANAYVVDVTSDEERSRAFGKMAISANIGFVLGPTLAGLLGATRYGELVPVLAAALISLVAMLVIWYYLPESRCGKVPADLERGAVRKSYGQELRECYELEGEASLGTKAILRLPHIPFILTMYFLIFLGFNFFYTSFPIHATQQLAWSVTQLGVFFAVLGLTMALAQGPLLSYLSRLLRDSYLVVIGALILAANFLLLTSHNLWIVFAGSLCFAIGNGLMWPSFLSILSKIAGRQYQGAVQGLASSFGSLASIVGLIVGGALYTSFGSVTFLISAGIILSVAGLGFRLRAIVAS